MSIIIVQKENGEFEGISCEKCGKNEWILHREMEPFDNKYNLYWCAGGVKCAMDLWIPQNDNKFEVKD